VPFELSDFETARLTVFHWRGTLRDAKQRLALEQELLSVLTPEVLEFLPPSLAVPEAKNGVSLWIDAREAESQVFLVTERETNKVLGLLFAVAMNAVGKSGLDEDTVHLGYLFKTSAWGQGYASELIGGFVSNLPRSNRPTVLAGVAHGNEASMRVLLKNGFEKLSDAPSDDMEMFKLSKYSA